MFIFPGFRPKHPRHFRFGTLPPGHHVDSVLPLLPLLLSAFNSPEAPGA